MARKHEDKWRLFQRADSHPALAESTRIEVLIAMGRVAGKLQPVPAGNSALEKEMGDKTDRLPRRLGTDFDSFATGLRAALRQSLKVILVGEIRDRDTLRFLLNFAPEPM